MISHQPDACVECLRRARLLGHLAPYIERIATGASGSRSPELLRLSNEELTKAAAPRVGGQILARVEATSEQSLRQALALAECWACCQHDPRYPAGLRDASDAPWALFGRGDPAVLAELDPSAAVTVVGARRAST